MTADSWLVDTRISYDTVAISYADQLRDALVAQPYLRAALALFAGIVHPLAAGQWRTRVADQDTSPPTCVSWASMPSASTFHPRWWKSPGSTTPSCGSRLAR